MKQTKTDREELHFNRVLLILLALFLLPVPVKRAVEVEWTEPPVDIWFYGSLGQRVTLLCTAHYETYTEEPNTCFDVIGIQVSEGVFASFPRPGANEIFIDADRRLTGSALKAYHDASITPRNRFVLSGVLSMDGRRYILEVEDWDIAAPIHRPSLLKDTGYYQNTLFLFDFWRSKDIWQTVDNMLFE